MIKLKNVEVHVKVETNSCGNCSTGVDPSNWYESYHVGEMYLNPSNIQYLQSNGLTQGTRIFMSEKTYYLVHEDVETLAKKLGKFAYLFSEAG